MVQGLSFLPVPIVCIKRFPLDETAWLKMPSRYDNPALYGPERFSTGL
nr:MAG TPA: hypothetical protein [Caudoviricetes sp.]